MGQKSNPIILRLNKTNQHWNSCWYSDDDYATPFIEDQRSWSYINSSQQQLKRFPPLSFVKRLPGDLQITLFSAKPARQFSKFRRNKYKNLTSHLITHNIFKKLANYEKPTINKVNFLADGSPMNASAKGSLMKKKGCFRSQLFLAIISEYNSLKLLSENRVQAKFALHLLSKKITLLVRRKLLEKVDNKLTGRNLTTVDEIKRRTFVKIVDPTRNHLEYSIYKYYNRYELPLTPVRNKLYLVKSPSIYQNPLFLASQVVSLLEERGVFRKIKHRLVREIRKNPIVKGLRIICSGRVASRSKKAQKARRESIQWGATSLNVLSEHVNFASCFAQTTFGKIGVKVWVSYNRMAH